MRLNSSNAQTGVMVNRPELCKEVSEVWDGSKWTSQPSVTIVTARQRLQVCTHLIHTHIHTYIHT